MKQIISHLIEEKQINKDNIIYIDKEDLNFDSIVDYKDLDEYIKQKII
jgi:hypothetical protein